MDARTCPGLQPIPGPGIAFSISVLYFCCKFQPVLFFDSGAQGEL
jgi:hypothetical protein